MAPPGLTAPAALTQPTMRAGLPSTRAWSGTDFVTTEPDPTIDQRPIVTPVTTTVLAPTAAPVSTRVRPSSQSSADFDNADLTGAGASSGGTSGGSGGSGGSSSGSGYGGSSGGGFGSLGGNAFGFGGGLFGRSSNGGGGVGANSAGADFEGACAASDNDAYNGSYSVQPVIQD